MSKFFEEGSLFLGWKTPRCLELLMASFNKQWSGIFSFGMWPTHILQGDTFNLTKMAWKTLDWTWIHNVIPVNKPKGWFARQESPRHKVLISSCFCFCFVSSRGYPQKKAGLHAQNWPWYDALDRLYTLELKQFPLVEDWECKINQVHDLLSTSYLCFSERKIMLIQ